MRRCWRKGVAFREAPRHEAYGTVAVFADLYGNLWDLIEPKRLTARAECDRRSSSSRKARRRAVAFSPAPFYIAKA